MIQFGQYILMGIIAIFAIGSVVIVGMMMLSSRKTKQATELEAGKPKEDTLAEQIQKQFRDEDERKERIIYDKSGTIQAKVKETRSAFRFADGDTDTDLTLESAYADDDKKQPFLNSEEKDSI